MPGCWWCIPCATSVWQKDKFDDQDETSEADSRYEGTLVTSVSAGINSCEDDDDNTFVLNHSSTASTLAPYEGGSNGSSPSHKV